MKYKLAFFAFVYGCQMMKEERQSTERSELTQDKKKRERNYLSREDLRMIQGASLLLQLLRQ